MSTNPNNDQRTGVVRNREGDDDHDDDAATTNNKHPKKTTTSSSNTVVTVSDVVQLTGLLPRPDSDSHQKVRRTSNSTVEEGNMMR